MQLTVFSTKTLVTMKMIAILMLMAALQVSARAYTQNVTLKMKHAPLTQVFRSIEQQTGYLFLYDDALLKQQTVTLDVANMPLQAVLAECFKNKGLTYKIVRKTIVIQSKPDVAEAAPPVAIPAAPPPDVLITGKVLDATSGEPVAGASVLIKGTRAGIATNQEGIFHIALQPGAVLVFSYIGYDAKEYAVKEPATITIRLVRSVKDTLSNLVITGYQVLKKDNYTGASTTVSGEDLKRVSPQNILQGLQTFDPSFRIVDNNLMGSNPNSLPNINVRGSTALPTGANVQISRGSLDGAANLPTFIIDGYEVSLSKVYDLDMNRVQSITLLKDAAATAVYGSRAANGVVVIVTKLPKAGKMQVTYNADFTVTTPDLSDYHVLNSVQKLDYEQLAGLYDATKNNVMTQDQLNALYYHKRALAVGGINTDWMAQPLRNTFGQKHSVFLEGGDSAMRYSLALRYQTTPGVMKGSGRDRYSTELGLSYNLHKKILFRNVLTVTQVNAKESPYGNFSDYVRMNPYYPKTNANGGIPQVIDSWVGRGNGGGGGYDTLNTLNPMFDATTGSFNKWQYLELNDALDVDWNIAGGLRLKGQLAVTHINSSYDVFRSPFANYYFNTPSDKLGQRGEYDYNSGSGTMVNGNLSLNYNRQVQRHSLNVVLNSNFQTSLTKSVGIQAVGFTNDRFTDISFANQYAANTTPSSQYDKTRLMGALFTINYAYDNRFLLDATVREDGSSQFGKDKRVAPFSSFGIGWNVHKEAFMQGSFISRLKLRATTGTTGSVAFAPYMAQTTYSYYTGNWYSSGIGAIVNNYGNTALEWQKTREYDLGMELGLFNDRILIMPRYYSKLTRGLVSDVSLPPSTGFASYKDNVGNMRNNGQELNIQVNVLKTKNLSLNLTANLVHNTNTIVKISNSLKSLNDKINQAQKDSSAYQGAPLLRYREGGSLDDIYAVRSRGIDPENGREIYVKKNGTLTYDWDVNDIVAVGNTEPKVEGTFGLNASYKQFYCVLFFYTKLGGQQYNQTLVDRVENADPRFNVDSRVFAQKWQKPGDHTFYKNIADLGQTQVSSRFVERDNEITLRSLYLSYDLDRNLCRKLAMNNLRIGFTTNDLWRWGSIKQERGIQYPFARSFNLSLQASF